MLIVNLLGLVLIGVIIWWFWFYKPRKAVDSRKKQVIIVMSLFLVLRVPCFTTLDHFCS